MKGAALVLAILLLGLRLHARGADPPKAARPNLVVILADDLGYNEQKLFEQLRLLPPGLHEIIFYPSVETEGLKKITNSWQQRVWEDRLFADAAVQRFLKENDIRMTDWKEVMARFKKASP